MQNDRGNGPLKRIKIIIFLEILTVLLLLGRLAFRSNPASPAGLENSKDFIRWVDFTVPEEALTQAFRMDVATCQQEPHLNWVELLAYLGARYGGDFSRYRSSDLTQLAEKIKDGASLEELTGNLKYYSYYWEAYGAVLDGMVGLYEIQIPESEAPAFALSDAQINEGDPSHKETTAEAESIPETETVPETESTPDGDRKVWVTKYGLKAFHPLAKNFPYSHYDDFGVARSYGYRRQHLGHDMMGQTGTPVIAVESGRVEAIGWNQYGGWRLGIRSFDGKRYYYYAHLRKNYPYQSVLKEGSLVTAGDVIGYLGRTGYSATENTNNIDEPHLHFGMQLIFDESQKEGNNEIWIDCYEIVKFLSVNRSEAVKKEGTKEWIRVYQMKDPAVGEITQ
ncbi:MAG: M23 family metallopeptidase [Clostridium sp.]|nr:M23 family metallopeptidase [Clostridium sp.]